MNRSRSVRHRPRSLGGEEIKKERVKKRTVAGATAELGVKWREKGKGALVRKECACSLSTTGPRDILSRVYLRGAGVINHGFVCLRESGPGRTRTWHVYVHSHGAERVRGRSPARYPRTVSARPTSA